MFVVRFGFVLSALLLVAALSLGRDNVLMISAVDATNVLKHPQKPILGDARVQYSNESPMAAVSPCRAPIPLAAG